MDCEHPSFKYQSTAFCVIDLMDTKSILFGSVQHLVPAKTVDEGMWLSYVD